MTFVKTTSEKFESVGIDVSQPAFGHRYGEESLALAKFCESTNNETVADLCSGCGVIGLYIAARDHPKKTFCVEIQPSLCEIIQKNITNNYFQNSVECVCQDYRDFAKNHEGLVDVVVSNPPFFPKGEGRMPSNELKAAAKHELFGGLEELFASGRLALKDNGRFALVFPISRKNETLNLAQKNKFEVLRDGGTCAGGKYFLCEFVKRSFDLNGKRCL